MNKTILVSAGCMGLIAVILGAFGAHGLEKLVTPEEIDSFNTGVRYQMYHALLLLFIGTASLMEMKKRKILYWFFISGTFLFSGSIYLLVVDEALGFTFSSFALLTPLGGTLLITGWIFLIFYLIKIK